MAATIRLDYVCEHGRTEDACEDCSYDKAKSQGRPLGGPPPAQTRAANAERVEQARAAVEEQPIVEPVKATKATKATKAAKGR